MGITHRRSKRARWMKLTSPDLLVAHMRHKDFSQARLGRVAGTSRQFIHLLIVGERSSCSERVGKRIEEALDVPPGTLFLRCESPVTGRHVSRRKTRVAA